MSGMLINHRKLQEWELVSQCNYDCAYCSLPNFTMELDEEILSTFMDKLDKNMELFLFGGEPFLHKKVSFVIDYLKKIEQPFVVQSNLSTLSVDKIIQEEITGFNLQGSIHPSEITIEELQDNLYALKVLNALGKLDLKRIDIMYIGKKSLRYYRTVQKIFPEICFMLPVSGFYEQDSCTLNKEYNIMRKQKAYSWIHFEENVVLELNKARSEVWEDQCTGKFSTFGKPCMYDYTLWDSKLNKYNCCYRENTNGTCNQRGCFFM